MLQGTWTRFRLLTETPQQRNVTHLCIAFEVRPTTACVAGKDTRSVNISLRKSRFHVQNLNRAM